MSILPSRLKLPREINSLKRVKFGELEAAHAPSGGADVRNCRFTGAAASSTNPKDSKISWFAVRAAWRPMAAVQNDPTLMQPSGLYVELKKWLAATQWYYGSADVARTGTHGFTGR